MRVFVFAPLAATALTVLVLAGCGDKPSSPIIGPQFTDPTSISNRYLPVSDLARDLLEGTAGGHKVSVERTKLAGTQTFAVKGDAVPGVAVIDRRFVDGELESVTSQFLAQADDGAVFCLGETVDHYRGGELAGHAGSWACGQQGAQIAVLLPARPEAGHRFDGVTSAGEVARNNSLIVSLSANVAVPSGSYGDCVKVRVAAAHAIEYFYYAPNVGLVRQVTRQGTLSLVSHNQ